MPRAYLILHPQQIVEVLKTHAAAGQAVSWTVEADGLPPDTKYIGLQTNGKQFRVELESADFIGGEQLPDVALGRTPGYSPEEMQRFVRQGLRKDEQEE